MYILGISAFYHDSAACLIFNGSIVAAAQEERFTRKKHDSSFPKNAIIYCLNEAGINYREIKNVVFYEKPFLKFERLLESYLAFAPRGFLNFKNSMPLWIKDKLFQKSNLIRELNETFNAKFKWKEKLLFSEHHLSHAASAYYPSPFLDAAILTLDGVGEWTTASIGIGKGNEINIIKEIKFPHSLGLLYSAFTYYAGFKVNSGEYKMMGLAPYGIPVYSKIIKEHLIDIKDDGSFHLNMNYFDYCTNLKMTSKKFDNLFGGPPRIPESKLTQKEMNLAASIQKVTEEILIKISKNIVKETGKKNLCLAGGVALNCVANGVLSKEKIFDKIWIQPASGDSGGALGAAFAIWHMVYGKEKKKSESLDIMKGSYLGPSYKEKDIELSLEKCQAKFHKYSEDILLDKVAKMLSENKAIGWMSGRMEFGPRALGSRSIIADPRSPDMQKQLNLKVKYRESFRPFAPSIIKEDTHKWFEFEDNDSPYMMMVAKLRKEKRYPVSKDQEELFGIEKLNITRSEVPAITHVDYSARIQTVVPETNKRYYELIKRFKKITDCPIIINTSFNVRGEPIVCTPEDAYKCFMGTELDILVIENFILYKKEQSKDLKENYEFKYDLD